MADGSEIEWTDATWNPVRGCKLKSPGCANCYAMGQAHRFSGPGAPYEGLTKLRKKGGPVWTGEFREIEDALDVPLRWKKPRKIFVNSMSDLFGEGVSNEFIDEVLARMLLAPQHTFQVLTKRADRMEEYLADERLYERVLAAADRVRVKFPKLARVGISNPTKSPVPWIWWGASIEDQERADERIPHLLRIPAAVRFLSIEPLLGPVDLREDSHGWLRGGIDWVIVGGESGPNARPMHPDWVCSIRDQCVAAGVPFFFKQWGEWVPRIRGEGVFDTMAKHGRDRLVDLNGNVHCTHEAAGTSAVPMSRVGKKAAGRMLDGRPWDEVPNG